MQGRIYNTEEMQTPHWDGLHSFRRTIERFINCVYLVNSISVIFVMTSECGMTSLRHFI